MTPYDCILPLALTDRMSVCLSVCLSVCMYACTSSGIDFPAAAPIKTMATMTITMMTMTSIMMTSSVASRQLLIYCPISAPNGTRLCAVHGQSSETLNDEKLTGCALATMRSQSAMFNYKQSPWQQRQCTLYHSPPWSYQQVDDCVGYEVIITLGSFFDITQTIIDPFNASCSKSLLFEGFSAILV